MNFHSLVLVGFSSGMCTWEIKCQLMLPLKIIFFSLVIQVVIAVLVAELQLLSVATEDTKGCEIRGNGIACSMPG